MRRRFVTLDVFTDRRFAGNPLAVVLEPDGLDSTAMQAIAREFNLSETVFVFPPADKAHRAKLRIFTPGRELPFAGHPTVGTAVLLARLDGDAASRAFIVEEEIGLVRCRVQPAPPDSGRATFDIPRLPAEAGTVPDSATLAAALSIPTADIGFADYTASRWSAGNPFTIVPVRGLDAIARCRPDMARFGAAFGGDGFAAPFVVCRETAEPGNTFHARMFAPGAGIAEDPATGSAAAAFAGYLAARGGYRDGEHAVRIEQGYEMGRPSLMELTLTVGGGKLTGAAIGGGAVVVSEGTIEA
jgi:trans-2,3-dihydro-3-hydroxyanthranilate isomerase